MLCKYKNFKKDMRIENVNDFPSGIFATLIQMTKTQRLALCRYLVKRFGIPFQTAYGKVRHHRFQQWEADGINHCISIYGNIPSGQTPSIFVFYQELTNKRDFTAYMGSKGMCSRTTFYRFTKEGFREWELLGFSSILKEFYEEGYKDPEIYSKSVKIRIKQGLKIEELWQK